MIDPRRCGILKRSRNGEFRDETRDVVRYADKGDTVVVTWRSGQSRTHSTSNVVVLEGPEPLESDARLEVNGVAWTNRTDVLRFRASRGGTWWRIFDESTDRYYTYPADKVRILYDASAQGATRDVLTYFRRIASQLPSKPDSSGKLQPDPLRQAYDKLTFVHSESALARYASGSTVEPSRAAAPLIFPFSVNLSQREAVDEALRHPVSVIDGPPGTGKTQTILSLVANLLTVPKTTVGIVSFNNAAVDNVGEKLAEEGFGYAVANLGNHGRRRDFFKTVEGRNDNLTSLLEQPRSPAPRREQIDALDQRLRTLQQTERSLAELRAEIAAYKLERRHFDVYVERQAVPEIAEFPLLQRASTQILDYLVEADHVREASGGAVSRLIQRVRNYFRFGPTRGLDPSDTDVVLRLQVRYYDKKIEELEQQAERHQRTLEGASFKALAQDHKRLSAQFLTASLLDRYDGLPRKDYSASSYRRAFATFAEDYPVILSTCHSLRNSTADGYLLDYLIIDEASQVDLLAAGLAMSCARNVVVVGDLRPLPQITDSSIDTDGSPAPAYDYCRHSILSSLIELYGETLPRTMLREHYRCDPMIIGFCNKKFYDGELIPYTSGTPDGQPLVVHRTVRGNHMRQHHDGGRSNQREIDVIQEEVIPEHCAGLAGEKIGITTPYRRQADKVVEVLLDSIDADTVHKFQGRQRDVIIMTTVLDETWRGHTGTAFVDGPHLVNVAVSRATTKFILVTNHDLLPTSRHLRDLIGYIRHQLPDHDVVDSEVVSVFDLLYRDYSERLGSLAARLTGKMRFRSEEIGSLLLGDILVEPQYAHLALHHQVRLRHLLPDLSRLTPDQANYAKHGSTSVDFLVYNRVTNQTHLAIEVDGFAFHENNPTQRVRDRLKDAICREYRVPLLRLPTTGSGEEERIRRRLDVPFEDEVPHSRFLAAARARERE